MPGMRTWQHHLALTTVMPLQREVRLEPRSQPLGFGGRASSSVDLTPPRLSNILTSRGSDPSAPSEPLSRGDSASLGAPITALPEPPGGLTTPGVTVPVNAGAGLSNTVTFGAKGSVKRKRLGWGQGLARRSASKNPLTPRASDEGTGEECRAALFEAATAPAPTASGQEEVPAVSGGSEKEKEVDTANDVEDVKKSDATSAAPPLPVAPAEPQLTPLTPAAAAPTEEALEEDAGAGVAEASESVAPAEPTVAGQAATGNPESTAKEPEPAAGPSATEAATDPETLAVDLAKPDPADEEAKPDSTPEPASATAEDSDSVPSAPHEAEVAGQPEAQGSLPQTPPEDQPRAEAVSVASDAEGAAAVLEEVEMADAEEPAAPAPAIAPSVPSDSKLGSVSTAKFGASKDPASVPGAVEERNEKEGGRPQEPEERLPPPPPILPQQTQALPLPPPPPLPSSLPLPPPPPFRTMGQTSGTEGNTPAPGIMSREDISRKEKEAKLAEARAAKAAREAEERAKATADAKAAAAKAAAEAKARKAALFVRIEEVENNMEEMETSLAAARGEIDTVKGEVDGLTSQVAALEGASPPPEVSSGESDISSMSEDEGKGSEEEDKEAEEDAAEEADIRRRLEEVQECVKRVGVSITAAEQRRKAAIKVGVASSMDKLAMLVG